MMMHIPDHPEIVSAMRTGYPTWNQPQSIHCGECGKNLDGETVYEDRYYEHLCADCLLMLHEKW